MFAVPALTVVVPVFNEDESVQQCLERMVDVLAGDPTCDFVIQVVDDGSTDSTQVLLRGLDIRPLRILTRAENGGKGAALMDGLRSASSPLVAQLDGDLDLHPSSLLGLLRVMKDTDADIVVGSKVHPESIVHYPRFRRLQSSAYRRLVRKLFDLDVADTQTGVKVYRAEVLQDVLPKLEERGYAFDLELLAVAKHSGFTIAEGPVVLDYQFSSSLPLSAAFTMLIDTYRIWRRLRSRRTG